MTILLSSLVIIGVLLAMFLYRKTPLFIPLRIVSIILLVLLIFNVALSFKVKKTYAPPLLLRDHSASVSDYAPSITNAVENIEYPHTVLYFSESLYTVAPDDTSAFGSFTNITGAIRAARAYEPSGIIVISDGNHNVTAEPLAQIRTVHTPVYCFGIGAATRRDAMLADVVYPEYAYAGDSIQIRVTVKSAGFDAGTGTVELQTMRGAVLQRATFPLSTTPAKNDVTFTVPVKGFDENPFRIALQPLSAEHSYSNNEASFSVRILEEKIRVLYYTEHLSLTTKFILQTLRAHGRFELVPIVRLAKGILRNVDTGDPVDRPSLTAFDVVILDNVFVPGIPWPEIEAFTEQGGGILCMGILEGQTEQWRDMLPIAASTPVAGRHQLMIVEPFSVLTPYDEHPPLATINRVSNVKHDAVIIAQADNVPVIAYRTHARGVVFQISTTDIGRWHFLMQGMKQEDILSDLVGDVVRFIAPSGHGRRLVLTSLHREYNVGDAVDVTLQSFDRDYRRASGGDFFMEYDTNHIPFFEVQKGVYRATFIASTAGTATLIASGKLHEEKLESNALRLTVHERSVESDQGLNQEFLEVIARETGGTYAHFDEFSGFQPPPPQEQHVVRTFPLDRPITYILIVLVLTLEWFMRRRRGTL